MDKSAFIFVLNYKTYITIAALLKKTRNDTFNSSKTSTVANQTEVPVLHCVTLTIIATIEVDSRHFIMPFAVADIKYDLLGTPFSGDYIQIVNTHGITLQFKHQ